MAELAIVKKLSVNCLFWVGIAAVLFGLLAGDFTFLLLFIALFLINYALLNAVRAFAPSAFNQLTEYADVAPKKSSNRSLGFRIYPLAYPKVMDEDLNDYAPEMIHVDIKTDDGLVFQGNFNRDALKQFKDALAQVLTLKIVVPKPAAQPTKKKPVQSSRKSIK